MKREMKKIICMLLVVVMCMGNVVLNVSAESDVSVLNDSQIIASGHYYLVYSIDSLSGYYSVSKTETSQYVETGVTAYDDIFEKYIGGRMGYLWIGEDLYWVLPDTEPMCFYCDGEASASNMRGFVTGTQVNSATPVSIRNVNINGITYLRYEYKNADGTSVAHDMQGTTLRYIRLYDENGYATSVLNVKFVSSSVPEYQRKRPDPSSLCSEANFVLRYAGQNALHSDNTTHCLDSVSTVSPSCGQEGFTKFSCDCGYYYASDRVPAYEHDWGEWTVLNPATCVEDGLERRICKNDASHVEENTLPATGHNEVYVPGVAPTCTESGYGEVVECSECGEFLVVPVWFDPIGHDWGEWTVESSATCSSDGRVVRICKNDNKHEETIILPALEHKAGAAATCTQDQVCTVCGGVVREKLGHDFSAEFTVDTEASYTQAGSKSKHCLREGCSEQSEVTEIPKLVATFTDSDMAVLANNVVMMIPGMNIKQLLSLASDGASLKKENGEAVESAQFPVTGMTLILPDGKEYPIAILGDADGDGVVSVADARLALRASVGLESYAEDSVQYTAANVGLDDPLSVADARLILRASVGLDDPRNWMQ